MSCDVPGSAMLTKKNGWLDPGDKENETVTGRWSRGPPTEEQLNNCVLGGRVEGRPPGRGGNKGKVWARRTALQPHGPEPRATQPNPAASSAVGPMSPDGPHSETGSSHTSNSPREQVLRPRCQAQATGRTNSLWSAVLEGF